MSTLKLPISGFVLEQAHANIDTLWGPYNSLPLALEAIPVSKRKAGFKFGVTSGNTIIEYTFETDGATTATECVSKKSDYYSKNDIDGKVGNMQNLTTEAKSTLVGAINELKQELDGKASTSALTEGLTGKQGTISDLDAIRGGAGKGATSVQGVKMEGDNAPLSPDGNGVVTIPQPEIPDAVTSVIANNELVFQTPDGQSVKGKVGVTTGADGLLHLTLTDEEGHTYSSAIAGLRVDGNALQYSNDGEHWTTVQTFGKLAIKYVQASDPASGDEGDLALVGSTNAYVLKVYVGGSWVSVCDFGTLDLTSDGITMAGENKTLTEFKNEVENQYLSEALFSGSLTVGDPVQKVKLDLKVGKTYIFDIVFSTPLTSGAAAFVYQTTSNTPNKSLRSMPVGSSSVRIEYTPVSSTNYQYFGIWSSASNSCTYTIKEKTNLSERINEVKSIVEVIDESPFFEGTYNVNANTQYRHLISPALEVGETYIFRVQRGSATSVNFALFLYVNGNTSTNTNIRIGVVGIGENSGKFEYTPVEGSNYQYLGFWTTASQQGINVSVRKKTLQDTVDELGNEVEEVANSIDGKIEDATSIYKTTEQIDLDGYSVYNDNLTMNGAWYSVGSHIAIPIADIGEAGDLIAIACNTSEAYMAFFSAYERVNNQTPPIAFVNKTVRIYNSPGDSYDNKTGTSIWFCDYLQRFMQIPEGTSHIIISVKNGNGVNVGAKLYKAEIINTRSAVQGLLTKEETTGAEYSGEKISLVKHYVKVTKLCKTPRCQGGWFRNGYFFNCELITNKRFELYKYENNALTLVAYWGLQDTVGATYIDDKHGVHANSMQMTDVYYDANDDFPIFTVAGNKGDESGKMYVMRLYKNGSNVWQLTKLYNVVSSSWAIGSLENGTIFDWGGGGIRVYNTKIVASSTDIQLSDSDVYRIYPMRFPDTTMLQDVVSFRNKLYQLEGDNRTNDGHLMVYDFLSEDCVNDIMLKPLGITKEPEWIDIENEKMYIGENGENNDGYMYELEFD